MASLVFTAGPNAGRRYELTQQGQYLIGRRPDCHIFVPDMRVSRQHARVWLEGARWCLEDLNSNNGTYVNGHRVQRIALSDQDEISIAANKIRVDFPGSVRRGREDSHVTIVDLDDARIFVSSESAEQSGSWRSVAPHESSAELRLLDRKLSAVSAILEMVANTIDPNELLEHIVSKLLDVFPQATSVGVLREDERTGELRVQCHKHRAQSRYGSDLRVPGTIIDHVIKDRRGVLLSHTPPPQVLPPVAGGTRNTPTAGLEEPIGTRMGAPIQARDETYGVVYVECAHGRFRQEDVDLLTSIAAQAGLAIHSARMHQQLLARERLQRDVRVARQIQRSLLPKEPPDLLGLDFAVHYEPAYEIGGDFYDFLWHDDKHLAFVIGDVAGKAISAALYMARLTSELRSRAGIARSPSRLLRRVNEAMSEVGGDDGMFATLFYAIYDLETRVLHFTNAGHVDPLLRRDGRVVPMHADRAHVAPIGIVPDMEIGEAKIQLHTGDLIVFTTDGVHEARDPAGHEYGTRRLARRIRSARGRPVDVIRAILQDVDSHIGSGQQSDDVTIVALQVGRIRARRRSETNPSLPAIPGKDGEPGTDTNPGTNPGTPAPTKD